MSTGTSAPADAVLVVESDDGVALPLQCSLERAGHPVERVATAAQALARLDRGFVLVVLDTKLPDMPGDRLARRILSRRPQQAVLVMCQGPTTGREPRVGATVSRLPMPFSLRDLLVEVHTLVGHAPAPAPRSRYDLATSPCREATPETVVGQVPQNVV